MVTLVTGYKLKQSVADIKLRIFRNSSLRGLKCGFSVSMLSRTIWFILCLREVFVRFSTL